MNSESALLIFEELASIETHLLALEHASEGGMDPSLSVPLLFRECHNLKSTLAMNGADIAAKLVHKAESCLDALRAGKGEPESEWVDLLLDVVDHVRKGIGSGEETENIGLSNQLKALLDAWSRSKNEGRHEIGFPLGSAEAQALREALIAGLAPYVLEKLIGEDMTVSAVEALPIFDAVAEAGTLIARRLVRIKGSGSVLRIVFATGKAREDLSCILFDPFYPITGYNERLRRILILDDEPTALIRLQNCLSHYGRIDTAQTANEALEKFAHALRGRDPYDILYLGLMISGPSAHEALLRIREQETIEGISPSKGARVVMFGSPGEHAPATTAGSHRGEAYLAKPLDIQSVEETMAELGFSKVSLTLTVSRKAEAQDQKDESKLKILIAEDDFVSRSFLSKAVMEYGAVDVAVDGIEAVEALKRSYESGEPYDIVFLDIRMPRKDGQTALREIRAFEESLGVSVLETCKVVMTTAFGDATNVMGAFGSQCEAYVTKPFSSKAIDEQLRKLFPDLPN